MGVAGGLQLFRQAWPDLKRRALAHVSGRFTLKIILQFYRGVQGFRVLNFTRDVHTYIPSLTLARTRASEYRVSPLRVAFRSNPAKCTSVTAFSYNPYGKEPSVFAFTRTFARCLTPTLLVQNSTLIPRLIDPVDADLITSRS